MAKVRITRGSLKQLRRALEPHLTPAELASLKQGSQVHLPMLPGPVWAEINKKRLVSRV